MATDGELKYGRFRINLRSQVLYDGESEVGIEPLPFKMVKLFMENIDRVFSRKELEDEFQISPESIATTLTKIRKILGDDQDLLDWRTKVGCRLKPWQTKHPNLSIETPRENRQTNSITQEDSGNRPPHNLKFNLSVDAIILNSVGELIFGFVSDRDIAECRSSYERALEDFAFSLVYGAELRAKWERRDPRLAPKEEPAEPAEFLIWSLPDAPYRTEKFSPEFHVDRIFENESDRDTILGYIRYMGICMRRRRFVEWCRDWLKRESVIYLGDDQSLFNTVKNPRNLVYGKTYSRDEILLKKIPTTLGESELATLVSFVPLSPSQGTSRAEGVLYAEQARVRFVLECVLTHITTMYQFEKHVAYSKVWRVPYGLRAELTKEFSKGHHQIRLKHILLSHALGHALHEISLSSDRVDLIHTLCEMRKHHPFSEIKAMLDELSLTLWREDDDDANRKAERFIEEIRRAGSGDPSGSMDTFFAAHSSVLRELTETNPDGYRDRLYKIFPELKPQYGSGPEAFHTGIKLVRGCLPRTLAG